MVDMKNVITINMRFTKRIWNEEGITRTAEECINEAKIIARRVAQKTYYMKNAAKISERSRKYYKKKRDIQKLSYTPGKNNSIKITVTDTGTDEQFKYPSIQSCAADMEFSIYRILKNLKDRIPFDGYMFEREEVK